MDTEALARSAVESTFDMQRRIFGADVCDVIGPTFTDGGAGGDQETFGTIAGGIDCIVEELAAANAQTVIGGETYVSSHQIKLKRSDITDALTPKHKIRVHPRGGNPEMVFEKPVAPLKSFTALVKVKASLVRQGYQ